MKPDITDLDIKSMLERDLPPAPKSDWFTRKVMNRLPEKRTSNYAWIEYAAYTVALLMYVWAWTALIGGMAAAKSVTVDDIVTSCVLAGIGFGVCLSCASPHISRWLRDI